jgi:hypothetical protein
MPHIRPARESGTPDPALLDSNHIFLSEFEALHCAMGVVEHRLRSNPVLTGSSDLVNANRLRSSEQQLASHYSLAEITPRIPENWVRRPWDNELNLLSKEDTDAFQAELAKHETNRLADTKPSPKKHGKGGKTAPSRTVQIRDFPGIKHFFVDLNGTNYGTEGSEYDPDPSFF